jgi:hypothetical protein
MRTCAAGVDSSPICERLALDAVDTAREQDGLGPMVLPADFPRMSVPEQFFIAVDRERVDRGLRPFVGMTTALDAAAQRGAEAGDLPRVNPRGAGTEWLGGAINGLDADYLLLYDDGPGSGTPGCTATEHSGCWSDRGVVLDTLDGAGAPVMGAALAPTGDHSVQDRGGTSFAAVFEPGGPSSPAAYAYTWTQATAPDPGRSLTPLSKVPPGYSLTGFANPSRNVNPQPDYEADCAQTGEDQSAGCLAAILRAINAAHRLEDLGPMVLPSNFAQMSVPEQIFAVIDLERVDRGLAPFVGLTAPLDANAQRGARAGDDPPDPGTAYAQWDTEWAFGSLNGLDADYGWMYFDGYQSGNLDCPTRHAKGCWGHRMGILDDFGTGGTLVMGAADDPKGAIPKDDRGSSSAAATLAVTYLTEEPFVYTWADVVAHLPPGA